jgi:undecaprenyl-diphosphatase
MLDFLNTLDTNLFLYLNGLHHKSLDDLMLAVSYNKVLMSLVLVAVLSLALFDLKKRAFTIIILSFVAFGLSDSISTRVFKDNFERLRPCHNLNLKDKVYLAGQNCGGGKYGFVSSHASNSFAIAFFYWLFLFKRRKVLSFFLFYAGLVSYSRIYLARHYPGDIIFGALLGVMISYTLYALYKRFISTRLNTSL